MHVYQFAVSTVEAAVLGRALGVEPRRFPLEPSALGADPVRLAALARMVYEDLEARGLSRRGELNPLVRQGFQLFATGSTAVGMAGRDGSGDRFTVLGLADGRDEVLVRQRGEALSFDLYDDDDLTSHLAGALPPRGGGIIAIDVRGRAGTRLSWMDTAAGRVLVDAGVPTPVDGKRLARVLRARIAELVLTGVR